MEIYPTYLTTALIASSLFAYPLALASARHA
jgi:hypothetical protein